MAQWAITLSHCGLYYMFIEPSLAGGFLWQGANTWSSYKTADPHHLLSIPAALTTHQTPDPGVMACHSLKRTQANPLYLPENIFS